MLSIDGVHIEKDLGLHLLADSDETALPQVRQDTVTIPGKHGAYAFDAYMEPRQFFERILIPTQSTLNDVQGIVRNISTLLLDQYGKAKTVKLVFDYEPDKYYMAKFSGFISIDRIAKAGIFPIPFKAYDPWAYATVFNHEINVDSQVVTVDDDYSIDTVFIKDEQITTNQTLEVYSNGYAVRPTILINGTGDNVTFQANGKSFSLKNFSNAEIEINGDNYTILKNSSNGFGEKIGRDFIELLPEMNELTVAGDNMNFNLSVIFRDKYM